MNRRVFFGTCAAIAASAKALPALANLEPVGPFGACMAHGELTAYYRTCDFCDWWAVDDIRAGEFDQSKWRQLYRSESECGLIVCEHCIPAYLSGE